MSRAENGSWLEHHSYRPRRSDLIKIRKVDFTFAWGWRPSTPEPSTMRESSSKCARSAQLNMEFPFWTYTLGCLAFLNAWAESMTRGGTDSLLRLPESTGFGNKMARNALQRVLLFRTIGSSKRYWEIR